MIQWCLKMFEVKDYEASKLYIARKCSHPFGFQTLTVVLAALLSAGLLIPSVFAGCASCGGEENWDPTTFLNSDVPGQAAKTSSSNQASAGNSAQSATQPTKRSDLFPNGQIIKPPQSVSSSDLVLDVSNDNSYSRSHIKGALLVPSRSFLNDDGTIKSVPEMTKILSNAGISPKDSVVVYSNKLSEAAFAFWTLRYLGQDNVKVLDGNLNDWNAAGLRNEVSPNIKPAAEYTPNPKSEILADYDYVKSGSAQLIDARSFTEFSKGRISGSISLDPAEVLLGGKVKNGKDLANMFSGLNKDKPVVVYSGDYYQASLLWYALQLMGYKGNIYTWQDWAAHQPASEKKETVPAGKSTANADRFKKLGTT
jgi:thiosulfate/3-mercaptopyruvate sulfurtransferase